MTTSQVRFRGSLRRALLLTRLLPWAALSFACGGTSIDPGKDKGIVETGGQANHGGDGAGGSGAMGGHGEVAGNGGAAAGSGGNAGASAGAGAIGGMGGSGAHAGSGGDSGSAGVGQAGSAGSSSVCHAMPPQVCAGGPITLPKNCISEAMASAGTTLPLATCRALCESMFTFSCTVSAVESSSITVQCSTGCPAGGD